MAVATIDLNTIDTSWTLFIDRDGVINHEKSDGYILNRQEFRFYDGVPEAMSVLAKCFGTILLVTNQRGIGRGLMTTSDLHDIHAYMQSELALKGGRLDKIYYCSDTESTSENRKPNPGMAWQAKADFLQIDFAKSIMIGNKLSDMQFGRNAGMQTIFVATTHPQTPFPHSAIDLRCNDLPHVALLLSSIS